MFGSVSGAHINPAMTIAQAVNGLFPWSDVLPYIVAQLLGALLGQLIVYITVLPALQGDRGRRGDSGHLLHH